MRVLVTGANGLLGHHVVIELLRRNHEVKVIVRDKNNLHFDTEKVHVIEGNFTDFDTLWEAANNIEAIIHIAAVTATHLRTYTEYQHVNVNASAQIIQIANQLHINNLVFISTVNTIGYGTPNEPGKEDSRFSYPFTRSFYAKSKHRAEEIFRLAAYPEGRHVILIHPGFMLGAYDTKPSSGKLMLMGYGKKRLIIPRGGKNIVSAKAVAVCTVNALTMGRNGESYLATGINLSFRDYFALQQKIGNYRQSVILLPNWCIYCIGKMGDLIRYLGWNSDICSANLNQLLVQEYYCNQKAKKELELPETNLEETIKETMEWFRSTQKIQ